MEAINEIENWYSEYELRQFIDIAKKYKINNKYSGIFESYVKNGRTNYEKFSKQLRDKLTTINNWEAIGLDLNSRFLVGFENYFIWYNENITEIKGMFDESKQICPYTIMLEIMKSTKKEILKYFPNIEKKQSEIEHLPPPPIKTKADVLKEQLSQYGFFELEKVKTLSEKSKILIIEKIAESGLPYAIAMFDFLEFISYLEKKHFDIKYKLNSEVSKWFDSDKTGRSVKGNISSLLNNTNEDKKRYTAYKHKEKVIKDYEQLK